jgi:threonine dehydratase
MTFIPPFDHLKVIEGQGTVGKKSSMKFPEWITFLFQSEAVGCVPEFLNMH